MLMAPPPHTPVCLQPHTLPRAPHVQDVDMFGPRIGFLKFKARALVEVGGDEGEGGNGVIEVPVRTRASDGSF